MTYKSSFAFNLIYVIRVNDESHQGCLKIGKTTVDCETSAAAWPPPNSKLLNQAAKDRINRYMQTGGFAYDLLHTELAVRAKNGKTEAFMDTDVHKVLERSGIKKKIFDVEAQANEWYVADLETVKKAIAAVKDGRTALAAHEITQDRSPVVFRPEQKEAIEKTKKRFKKNNSMLWNAKMRFGKTLSALQVVKDLNFRRTLILTHRPAVKDGWFDDFQKIFYDRSDFRYASKTKGASFSEAERAAKENSGHYVYFASMQDLRGSEQVGGKFDKNDEIFGVSWDLVVIDEAHEGTQTNLGQSVLKELEKPNAKTLLLSGTPFNLLDDYDDEGIYTWDYVMEQTAKEKWDARRKGDPNPYAVLPHLNIYTFDLGKTFDKFQDEELAFNFREFFRVDENDAFIHDADIGAFLDLICKSDDESNYPYSRQEYRDNFRHSLWMVPGVKAARALAKKLRSHKVFGQFEIVNVAGDGDEEIKQKDALQLVKDAIGSNPEDAYTITISCGRLTTGVSVPAWTAVFMLSGSFNTSAASYMQTIFRCQTPATINGRMKTECFVFDFAPDRTLRVVAEMAKVSAKSRKDNDERGEGEIMGEFLNFCPIIAVNGTKMDPYPADRLMEQIKNVYIERAIRNGFEDACIYNTDMLMKLDDGALSEFDKLKKIIGATKAMPKSGDIDLNRQGFTEEEYEALENAERKKRKRKELTPEELNLLEERNEKKKNRDSAISILRGISIRIPLMMYGAELKDDEKIDLDNFAESIDPKSWEEFMPRDVTKQLFNSFKKYYDPDVFRGAWKRIRATAKAADAEDVEERIACIARIFNTFRNPDKETVLTPWRVVNMHLSECLGGFSFWNEDFTEPVSKPRWTNRGSVTAEVFAPDSRILEINSKSGLYPLYMAYSIYRARARREDPAASPETWSRERQCALWSKVVEENIFVVCKTKMAKSITKRTLRGFRETEINAHCFDDLVALLKDKPRQFIERVARKSFWKKGDGPMKFDAVVGNPPYQEETAQKQSATNGQAPRTNVFQYFQMAADGIAPTYSSLIYPAARWIHRSGKGMEKFGLEQINDKKLQRIDFYPDSKEIFQEVAIADGLSIVLKNKNKTSSGFSYVYHRQGCKISVILDNPGLKLIPLNPNYGSIVNKVDNIVESKKLQFLHSRIMSRGLFGIESNFVEQNPTAVREFTPQEEINFSTEIKLFTNDKAGKKGRSKWFVASRNIIATDVQKYIDQWQVVVSSANAGGQKRDNQISIMDNHSAFGRSRVALASFATEQEAKNFYKYAQTDFARFMFLMTDESLSSLGKKVPDLLDYTNNNKLIDFSSPLDPQLYKIFGLSSDEINSIKAAINPKE